MPGMLTPQVRIVMALALGAVLLYAVVRRAVTDEDISVRYQTSAATGSTSLLMSGTHVVLFLAGAIALVTWPFAIRNTAVGLALAGAVVASWLFNKAEVEGN